MVRNTRVKPQVCEWYPDRDHGGNRGAERVARERDAEVEKHATAPNSSHKGVLTRRNSSGKVGVRLCPGLRKSGAYPSWEAFWTDESDKRHTIKFSWAVLGDEPAKRCAGYARDHESKDRELIERKFAKI